jgi:hypothetical protein
MTTIAKPSLVESISLKLDKSKPVKLLRFSRLSIVGLSNIATQADVSP